MSELDVQPADPIDPKAQKQSEIAARQKELDTTYAAASAELVAIAADDTMDAPSDLSKLETLKAVVPDYRSAKQALAELRRRAESLATASLNYQSETLAALDRGENPAVMSWDEFVAANGGG